MKTKHYLLEQYNSDTQRWETVEIPLELRSKLAVLNYIRYNRSLRGTEDSLRIVGRNGGIYNATTGYWERRS